MERGADHRSARRAEAGQAHAHDELRRWESARFSTLTFFLEPVAVSLNHAIAAYRPASVQLIGLSGGGWTTTVYAALDPRITRSSPVAGSLPFYLRKASRNVTSSRGDWDLVEDATHGEHTTSAYAFAVILHDLGVHHDDTASR